MTSISSGHVSGARGCGGDSSSYEEFAYRIEFFGDEITNIDTINPLTGELLGSHDQIFIYPAVHYVMPEERMAGAVQSIKDELEITGDAAARRRAKLLEAQRLIARHEI